MSTKTPDLFPVALGDLFRERRYEPTRYAEVCGAADDVYMMRLIAGGLPKARKVFSVSALTLRREWVRVGPGEAPA